MGQSSLLAGQLHISTRVLHHAWLITLTCYLRPTEVPSNSFLNPGSKSTSSPTYSSVIWMTKPSASDEFSGMASSKHSIAPASSDVEAAVVLARSQLHRYLNGAVHDSLM